MARPTKERRVELVPEFDYFKPVGKPLKELEEICLTIEEVEALRLKDLEGLTQEEAAEKMDISRPTFQRILTMGRKKLADALVNGYAIRLQGGNYRLADKSCPRRQGRGFKQAHRKRGRKG